MPMHGNAAVAMWWRIAPEHRPAFEDWHSHEHFPERMGIPGFRRGSRWSDAQGGDEFFVCYELDDYDVLTSQHYRARLNEPTPWSTQMMPLHLDMVRSQCVVVCSRGGSLARHMLTVRLSAMPGVEDRLSEHLADQFSRLATAEGITGAHLLHTRTPETEATTEQRIRGGQDAVADWILLATGYDRGALQQLAGDEWGDTALTAHGARAGQVRSLFTLSDSRTPTDA